MGMIKLEGLILAIVISFGVVVALSMVSRKGVTYVVDHVAIDFIKVG